MSNNDNQRIDLSMHVSLDENGLLITEYFDLNGIQSNEGIDFNIKYETIEKDYFDSIVFEKNGLECINPNSSEHECLKREIDGLKKFTKSIEDRFNKGIENFNKLK